MIDSKGKTEFAVTYDLGGGRGRLYVTERDSGSVTALLTRSFPDIDVVRIDSTDAHNEDEEQCPECHAFAGDHLKNCDLDLTPCADCGGVQGHSRECQ